MTYDALLMSGNAQYRKMLQIGTWLSHDPKPKGSTFKTEGDLYDVALNLQGLSHNTVKCSTCNKVHTGECKVH